MFRRRVAAAPRPRRGCSLETSRGRGFDVDIRSRDWRAPQVPLLPQRAARAGRRARAARGRSFESAVRLRLSHAIRRDAGPHGPHPVPRPRRRTIAARGSSPDGAARRRVRAAAASPRPIREIARRQTRLASRPRARPRSSPSNPTGATLSAVELKALAETCAAKGVRFISDEIYHHINYTDEPSASAVDLPGALVINSFSKYFSPRGASEDGSRRRRGRDEDSPWRRVAATPRPRRRWRRVAATPRLRRG